jgi:formate hydrogenlyase subunit 6/NADH:ubiquinone oxidoreductase subunit I
MADIEKLRAEYEHAEEKAQSLMADKDDALQKVIDKYRDKMRDANQRLADAQKALCDAEAAAALVGRDDAETVAANLGLTLPD